MNVFFLSVVVGKSAAADLDTGVQADGSAGSEGKAAALPPPSFGNLACSATQPIGALETKWDWTAMISGMKTGVLKASNIIMLIDTSQVANFQAQLRFCYNVLRLFQLSGSTVSVISYGSSPTVVLTVKAGASEGELKTMLAGIKAKAETTVNCGQALQTARTSFFAKLKKNLRSLMFVVARSNSADDVYKAVEQLKGAQLIISAVGM